MSSQALQILADGEWHSGEELSEALSVSRTAVWKSLKKLSGLGLEVEALKGKGYKLKSPLSLLDKEKLKEQLSASDTLVSGEAIHVHWQIDSTNEEAKRELLKQPNQPVVILTESQTQGRGRRGRVWQSPFAENLYLTIGWPFTAGISSIEGLSLAVGLVVADVLTELGIADVSLKWPNDVLVANQKIAGVLIDISGDPLDCFNAVVGVGLNVNMSEAVIDQSWTSVLSQTGAYAQRTDLAAALIERLSVLLSEFQRHGFSHYHESWSRYDSMKGRQVVLSMGDQKVFGVSCGVDQNGAVLIECDGTIRAYNGGEISLRLV